MGISTVKTAGAKAVLAVLRERGWLKDAPLFPRLSFSSNLVAPEVNERNVVVRDRIIGELVGGLAVATAIPPLFGVESELLVADVDRYGLPCPTMLGLRTGILRTTPYYDDVYSIRFYREMYRSLYSNHVALGDFLSEQVAHGQRILGLVRSRLPGRASVLDVGCGMGGALIPFRLGGHKICGCDVGGDYLEYGRALGLDLVEGEIGEVESRGPFDVILLSHVLEHMKEPRGFLAGARRLLSDGGVLYIEVPGVLNICRVYQGDILEFLQSAHVWHFTKGTLAGLLKRCGFDVVEGDETVVCIAGKSEHDPEFRPADGPRVMGELKRLEASFPARKIAHGCKTALRALWRCLDD